ncbi:hypothetical protein B296_00054684 [Ensete ventricosum]|uniref:Glycosyl transferase family 1 domain-containing protein n=1 Tax=Ensete ventricosum TaxID=4639 RepID=A0A426X169_ENSVE|nr:hypothetical protein B296_00054684 [Ensete ventricosum]
MPAVFTGMLQGEELSKAYASGDVFLMPSESETLGQVVLEAMSSGVPVVAARAGGIPDIIPEEHEGRTSFLFTPGDLDDCLNKIKHLLACDDFRDAMGRAAREEMEKHDWRAATRIIRDENYNAAILFWRKERAQPLGPIQWMWRRSSQAFHRTACEWPRFRMLNGTTFHRALRRTGTGRPTHGPSEVEVDPEKVVGGEAVGGSAWVYERACSRWPRQALPGLGLRRWRRRWWRARFLVRSKLIETGFWPSGSGRVQLS